jgi:hypothetical protein
MTYPKQQTFKSKKSAAKIVFMTGFSEYKNCETYVLQGFRSKRHKKGTWIINTTDKAKAFAAGTRWMKRQDEIAEEKAKKKAEQKAMNAKAEKTFVEGTILYTSWGYDQTNIEFFKIISRKGSTVELRELRSEIIQSKGFMTNEVTASDEFYGDKVLRKRVQVYNGKEQYVKIHSSAYAYLWDGKPRIETNYA